MPKLEELKIFLASPSDVARERRYVVEVIEEINNTVAPSKGVRLRVVSSEHTFPGYGQDGQAVLNAQIGTMKEYELFIGIMWSRVGTLTPRADSGTIEEFNRATRAFKRHGKPEIWFYFRKLTAQLDTQEKLEQAQKVVTFKKKLQGNALFHDYSTPSNFRDRFRKDILLWLNARTSKVPKSRATTSSRSNKSSTTLANFKSSATTEASRKKPSSTSTAKKQSPASSRSTTRATRSVSSSGDWALLNDNLFLTASVDTQENQTVTLRISPATPEQKAVLRNLQPDRFDKKQVTYAHEDEAAIMQVESICSSSSKGKTTFVLTLKPAQQSQGNSMEVNLSGYSADEIAKLRTRLLLLNETPNIQSKNDSSLINHYVEGYDSTVKIKKSIFPDLWKQLKTQPQLFLYHARLAAVYYLKMSRTVEHILELKLSLIKGNVMSIRFRGQRKQIYSQEPAVIEVIGDCHLEA
jgi:hypothetical protein